MARLVQAVLQVPWVRWLQGVRLVLHHQEVLCSKHRKMWFTETGRLSWQSLTKQETRGESKMEQPQSLSSYWSRKEQFCVVQGTCRFCVCLIEEQCVFLRRIGVTRPKGVTTDHRYAKLPVWSVSSQRPENFTLMCSEWLRRFMAETFKKIWMQIKTAKKTHLQARDLQEGRPDLELQLLQNLSCKIGACFTPNTLRSFTPIERCIQ